MVTIITRFSKWNQWKYPFMLSLFLMLSGMGVAQDSSPAPFSYRMPPTAIADGVDAPLTPSVSVGPNQNWMLLMAPSSLPPIKELAQPELRLAGRRINPRTNGPSRSSYFTKLTLKQISDGSERPVTGLPEGGAYRQRQLVARWSAYRLYPNRRGRD